MKGEAELPCSYAGKSVQSEGILAKLENLVHEGRLRAQRDRSSTESHVRPEHVFRTMDEFNASRNLRCGANSFSLRILVARCWQPVLPDLDTWRSLPWLLPAIQDCLTCNHMPNASSFCSCGAAPATSICSIPSRNSTHATGKNSPVSQSGTQRSRLWAGFSDLRFSFASMGIPAYG